MKFAMYFVGLLALACTIKLFGYWAILVTGIVALIVLGFWYLSAPSSSERIEEVDPVPDETKQSQL